jgi:hypothetical protein
MGLVDTLIDPLRSGYSGRMDKNEWRKSRYGALDTFQKQTAAATSSILSAQDIANIKRSYGLTTKIPVLDFSDVQIGALRSCVIQPDANTSRMLVVTFVSYVFGFTMIPAMYKNNSIGYELDWQKKMQKYLLKLAKVLDTSCVNKLNTDRNRVWDGLLVQYPQIANALQVPYADRADVYNQISGIMNTADFPSANYDIVANGMHEATYNKLASNGRTNADNTAYQLAGFDVHYTNNITPNSGVRDTLFIVPDGSVALVNRNDPDAIAGTRLMGGGQVWDEVDVPMIGMKMGTYYTEHCADATAIYATPETNGLTRTALQGFEFSTDVCLVTAYNSDPATRKNPIVKAEISA